MRGASAIIAALLISLPASMVLAQDPAENATFVWPQHEDVEQALRSAAASSNMVTVESLGYSTSGNELLLAVITNPDSNTPMDERVVTLITTQQHGNEPAGTPAALQLLDDIVADGNITTTLANQVLLLWPQANPDGATANSRGNGNGTDLNRDHVHVTEPEVIALHQVVLQRWDVHVGMDHHEYSGTGPGYPVPVRSYDWDATILYPRHGNVREPTQQSAVQLYEHLIQGLDEHEYSAGEYGVQTAGGVPVSHVAGGPDPGILRNNFGLNNVAGLLVETFVNSANPLVTPERRTDIHYQVMLDTLEYSSANSVELISAKTNSETLNVNQPLVEYIEEWPEDPATGEPNSANVRSPLAAGYDSPQNLNDIMIRHGLPPGIADEESWQYIVAEERQGLLAAILHPDSTRVVAETTPLEASKIGSSPTQEGGEIPKDTPSGSFAITVLTLLGLVFAMVRRQQV